MNQTQNHPEDYYQEAGSWYDDMTRAKEKQIALYHLLCLGLFACLSLALIGLTTLLSRQTIQPFLALVDKRTGEVTTPIRLNTQTMKLNWNMVRHFVTTYVNDKESYNYLNLNEPYQTVMALSSKDVKAKIDRELRPELNPNSPIKQLGRNFYVTVTIHSIAKLSSDNLLDIRFTTHIINSETNAVERSKAWRTTLRWELVNKKRTLNEWDKNPLGFTVTFYDKQPVIA